MTPQNSDHYESPEIKRRDWKIISLIGAVHSSSHFFQLVLPTLYLSLANEYGYDFTQLGLLASMFFLVSCLGQASSGFVVDRVGAGPVLHFGLAAFIVSGVLIAISGNYFTLLVAALIGGVGNSIFHPVDYSIINHRISPSRLGHAFSVHGLTGNLGWALTPVFMATLIHLFNWRVAALGASALVAVVLVAAWLGRHLLAGRDATTLALAQASTSSSSAALAQTDAAVASTPAPTAAGDTAGQAAGRTAPGSIDLAHQTVWKTLTTLLAQPALWGAFLFFACTSIALSSVQNYTIPMLGQVYGIDKVLAGSTLSAYMLLAAAGMAAGGFLAGATPNAERTVAVSLVLAGMFLLLLVSGALPSPAAMVVVGLAGFCSGVSAPSRDMLIRRVTPKGATGTVYGLVYSGMDVGSSLAPAGFGLMLDLGFTYAPWIGAAMAFVAAAGLALWVAHAATSAVSRSAQATAS